LNFGQTATSAFENGSPGRIDSTTRYALFKEGIPITAFEVDDISAETKRLKKRGVQFTMNPTDAGPVQITIFSDTCGNLIQIYQPPQKES